MKRKHRLFHIRTWFLLVSSQAPHVAPDCGLLEEAYLLFHRFLAWPEPCSSASKTLLKIIQKERRAPGSERRSNAPRMKRPTADDAVQTRVFPPDGVDGVVLLAGLRWCIWAFFMCLCDHQGSLFSH